MENPIPALSILKEPMPVDAAQIAEGQDLANRTEVFKSTMDDMGGMLRLDGDNSINGLDSTGLNQGNDPRVMFGGGGFSDVEKTRSQVISDVIRPGLEPEIANDTALSGNERLIQQTKALYADLTNYQVAWSVLQHTQKDIAQLLRGS